MEIAAYFFMVYNSNIFEDMYYSTEVIQVSKNNIYSELVDGVYHELIN